MAERPNYSNDSQTLVVDADNFDFIAVEQENGRATLIRFKLFNPSVKAGDVLVVLSGSDVHFHGMIGLVDDDWGVAADRAGSILPSTIQ